MNEIQKAASVLNQEGILIYPTETTYAIGAKLDSKSAIAKVYLIKNRPVDQPTSVIFSDLDQAKKYCYFTKEELKIARDFWPGPLTICLKPKVIVPSSILGGKETVGVRVPSLPWVRNLIKAVNTPLICPSANFKGKLAPVKRAEIDKKLIDLVDYVVDIEPEGRKPSTIIQLTGKTVKIIRDGEIKRSTIIARLKGV